MQLDSVDQSSASGHSESSARPAEIVSVDTGRRGAAATTFQDGRSTVATHGAPGAISSESPSPRCRAGIGNTLVVGFVGGPPAGCPSSYAVAGDARCEVGGRQPRLATPAIDPADCRR
jgi:hypothetical protein